MAHVALLFPPFVDPRSPHLAVPSLAAHLRRSGIRTTVRDVNLDGLEHLLRPERIEASVRDCVRRLARRPDERERLEAALPFVDLARTHAPRAPEALRDPARFYRPHAHRIARESIGAAIELASAARGAVACTLRPISYAVDGVNPARLDDLARATADPAFNLYHDFYREDVLPALDADPPDVVGVSILNGSQIIPGLTLARALKERGHFVVIGGTVYSKFVPELLARPEFFRLFCDALIAYEGEAALVELANQLAGARDLTAVPNLLHLDASGRVVAGPVVVEDADALPTPDFDGLPLDRYLAPAPVLPILTGKGCYFNRCKFCDIPFINSVSSKAYRVRSAERIAADIATLHRRHGARHFEITDEALSPALLVRLADALDAYPDIEPRFVGYARLERGFTAEVCRRIEAMGMRKLYFGLESGSQATLDHMDKGIRADEARAVLRNCADAGIAYHVFSIIGFPEETEERARETFRFFVDAAPLFDDPRTSFDIHPFDLDLRTDYFINAESYGIGLDAFRAAAEDFPLSAPVWENACGLSPERVEELLAEFHGELARLMPQHYPHPNSDWPAYEEYTILYMDHYAGRPFRPVFSLGRR